MSHDELARALTEYVEAMTPSTPLPRFADVEQRLHRKRRRIQVGVGSLVCAIGAIVGLTFSLADLRAAAPTSPTVRPAESIRPASLQDQLAPFLWTLQSISTSGVVWRVPANLNVRLSFSNSSFVTDDGCTVRTGGMRFGTTSLQGSDLGSTAAGCSSDPGFARVSDALAILTSTARASVANSTLTISNGSVSLLFTRGPLPAPAVATQLQSRIDGIEWRLVSLVDHGRSVALGHGSVATFSLSSSQYVADDGCNRIFGYVSARAASLNLRTVSQSDGQCDPGTTEVDPVFAETLSSDVTVSTSQGFMAVTHGSVKLTFEAESNAPSEHYGLPAIGAKG